MKKIVCILSLVLLYSCYKEQQPAVNSVIIELYAASPTAPADGATTTLITADIPGQTIPGSYNLNFFTTDGLFYDSQKSSTTITTQRPVPDSTNRAGTALLVSAADTGNAKITVSASDISRSINVKFVRAYPQSVKLSTSTQFISETQATTEATLVLALLRSPGIATPNTNVQITAVDSTNKAIGNFRNGSLVKSDKTGNATFYFSPDLTPYRGRVLIKAWLSDQPALADSLYVNITN